ncbi:MAG: hypothetical protein ABJ314_04845, partial [Ilumatobacter sp.]
TDEASPASGSGSVASWTSTFVTATPPTGAGAASARAASVDDADHRRQLHAAPGALVRSTWLRHVALWAVAAAGPGAFVGDLVGAALVIVGFLALVAWSAVTAVNVRRACPPVQHGRSQRVRAPHPASSVAAWVAAPVVAVGAAVGLSAVGSWTAAAGFEDEGPRLVGLAAAAVVAVAAVLVAAYQPYAVLARCATTARADSAHVRRWFMAPLVAVAVAAAAQGLVRLASSADERAGTATAGPSLEIAALWVASLVLPWVTWLVFARRAMRSLDSGVVHTHGRAVREALEPTEMTAFAASLMAPNTAPFSAANAPPA